MEEVELELINSTPFASLSRKFPGVVIYRWCSSVIDYLEMYGDVNETKRASKELRKAAGEIDSFVVSHDDFKTSSSTAISCRCTVHNSTIRLAESMNLLWEAPAIYTDGKEKLRLIAFSNNELKTFVDKASAHGAVEIVRKRKIEPDSLRDIYSISLKDLFGGMTAKQVEYLREAISRGMFDTPKRVKVEELARVHGITKSTMQEHIMKAENKLIRAVEPYITLYVHSEG